MWKKDRCLALLGAVGLAGVAMSWWAVQAWGQQPKAKEAAPPSAYQYIGVQQTIARVDTRTGRIDILCKRGEPTASMLMPDTRPWEWREVPLRESRSEEKPEGGKPGDRTDGSKPGDRGEAPKPGDQGDD